MARETQGSPADEQKLEQYGVWVKVKPRDVTTAPALEESFELSDLESPKSSGSMPSVSPQSALMTEEEEKLLDELQMEEREESAFDDAGDGGISVPEEEPLLEDGELPAIESAATRSESADLDLEDISEETLPELEEDRESAEVEVTLSEGIEEEDHFDDLEALESELASVTTKARDPSASSAEILTRIEDELKSIRTDLNQLRHDLSGLRKSAAESGAEGPASAAGSQGGFFDEDEDETIALTGDELDNILNTAEITEESAETPGGAPDMDLMPATEGGFGATEGGFGATEGGFGADILGYETPTPEAVEAPVPEAELEVLVEPGADDALVLTDDDLLPMDDTQDGARAATDENLPSDLVLEELGGEDETPKSPEAAGASELPEIDLEGIPEMESEPSIAPAPSALSAMDDDSSETIDLETLDLGEEPTVIDAVPEQMEDLEELQDAEEVLDHASVSAAEPADEVDLEALAREAEELEDNVPVAPLVEDLELGELETLSDDEAPAEGPQKEIEISFEGELAEDVEALQDSVESPVEEIAEAEEVTEGVPGAAAPASGIPDNLKDEIRTVLKYMDHLLEALPDEKIQEFAGSDYFVMYKKLFEDLGLGE
jgi:pilus assembly protein FimV